MIMERLAPLPCKLMLALGTNDTLDEEAVTVKELTGVSASPIVNAIGPVGVLSAVDWGSMAVMVGGSFATTVNIKFVDAVLTPSLTVIVIVEVPVWPAVGVIVVVLLAPLPANSMFAFATNAAFEDVPETDRLLTGVSVSATVNAIASVGVSTAVD
jgi:hypothetical protein